MTEQTATDPRTIPVEGFPADAVAEQQLLFALRYAVLAPSGHNTQPWSFHVAVDMVEVQADRLRALSIVDPAGRELVISCGAALFFLRVALNRFGLSAETELLPDADRPDLMARVRLGSKHDPTAEERVLFDAIPSRHTNRQVFQRRPVPDDLIERLGACAASEDAWLEAIEEEPGKRSLAGLIAEANRMQFADDAFRGELASWIRDPRAGDGMLTHGVPFSAVGESLHAFFRTFDAGGQVARDEQELALGSPLLAVLGTEDDGSRAWLTSGQALGKVLLTATAAGVSASFLNQPIQVPSQRPLVAQAIGRSGYPQLVLRLGYGPPPATHTPRRPFEDVLT